MKRHRFLTLSLAVLFLVGCGSDEPRSEDTNPSAQADGDSPADSNESAWYEKTWNAVSQTASDAWDGTKSYSLAAKDRVSQWSTDACDWMADCKFTYSRLVEGRYDSFSNEAAMRERCSNVTSKAGLHALPQTNDAEFQEARNLLNAGKLVAAVEQYDRWQQSWVKGPEAPPLDQIKEGLLAPTVLFAANYLRAVGEGPSTHGFIAEAVNYDQLLREHPNLIPQYTRPGSQSVDLVLFNRNAAGGRVLVGGIQTKACAVASTSLREGLDDAQTFFANRFSKTSFELYIPKDQFEELTSKGSIDPRTFQLTRPDEYLDRLSKNVKKAYETDGMKSHSLNASRLRGIVENHGNPKEFNRRILVRTKIRPLDRDYEGIKQLQKEYADVKRSLVDRSAYRHFLENMPTDFSVATNAAAVAAAFSAVDTLWSEGASVESAKEASKQAAETAAKTFRSTYRAHGVMRRVGSRLFFATFIDAGAMDGEELSRLAVNLPKKEQALFAAHYAGTAFIATFIFDQSGTVLGLARGDVDGSDFLFETGQNLLTAGASSFAAWATVALGFTPGGCVVAAAAIGTHVLIGTAKNIIKLYDARRHLRLADFIGRLPPEIANRCTPFDPQRAALTLEGPLDRDSVFDRQRPSVFEKGVQKRSIFEP